ncbi:acyl-CoA N-acyltransferase [Coniella lustricola]|uniref:Glucosamine 6-phosphate N-acetyltransferase n=1 Tax=Coniella lustricola TaxID=2025994 RepID=A0A2T2ZZP0_9PEZI|nr:acyl-CoA N-acyltransferase [Coniella lustricola]
MPSSTTPPSAAPIFSPSLLPAPLPTALPPGFTLRPLTHQDYHKGYLDCLAVLTHVGALTQQEWDERYAEMAQLARGTYYLLVIEHDASQTIIGTGSLVVERKFIHNRGLVGHIEEIAIAPSHQAKGLGLAMLNALDAVARQVGCYKNILNCGAKNEPFYVKCGYHNSGIEMSRYFEEAKDDYHRG